MRILFVCLGNICRSPTAEGLTRSLTSGQEGFELDSAGTGGWHVGAPPDARAAAAAAARGITLTGAARQVSAADFERFDLLVAMDRENEGDLLALAPDETARSKVRLLRSWDPAADSLDVPDPYYGGPQGFERTLAIIEAGCRGMLRDLR